MSLSPRVASRGGSSGRLSPEFGPWPQHRPDVSPRIIPDDVTRDGVASWGPEAAQHALAMPSGVCPYAMNTVSRRRPWQAPDPKEAPPSPTGRWATSVARRTDRSSPSRTRGSRWRSMPGTSGSHRHRRPRRSGSMHIETGQGEIRFAPDNQSRARPARSGRATRRPIGGDFGSRRVAPGSAQSRTTDEVKSLLLNTLNA